MKRILFLLIALLLTVLQIQAQADPQITSFSTTATSVGRTALTGRTARIPVTWTTANRPLTATLLFEQILPDGNPINVELPRLILFVASNGDGIAAPILPGGDVSTITLRVRLVNTFTFFEYDSAEIILPIIQGNSGSDGSNSNVMALTAFDVNSTPLSRSQLDNGNLRIPVSWTAVNRPTWANLIFEQVLPDGTVVNVELPRPFLWVNSSDSGVVAPVSVGDANEIILRVRLVDISQDRTYDQLYASIPIQTVSNPPDIIYFRTRTISIASDVLENTLIDVSWAVSNRPDGSNLVFEQILPDGRVRNAELPRDVLLVPSVGNGLVQPILPADDSDELRFRLRVVDLSNNLTLDSEEISINLIDTSANERISVTGDACYTAPFPPDNGVRIGGEGRAQYRYNGAEIRLYVNQEQTSIVTTMIADDTFTIEESPYCSYIPTIASTATRQWYVNFNGQSGWVQEFNPIDDSYAYYFIPVEQDDIPVVQIDNFSISPDTVDASAFDSTDFVFSWETTNATHIEIGPKQYLFQNLVADGTFTLNGSDWFDVLNSEVIFILYAYDLQGNHAEEMITVNLDTTAFINSFTVSPDTAAGNEQVTLSWDISGDFASANIWQTLPFRGTVDVLHTIDSNTGTFVYTLPDDFQAGNTVFHIQVRDSAGLSLEDTVTINYTCAYDWGFTITEDLCPASALISRTGAYQAFQRGFMVWLPSDTESMWVFYNDGTAQRYQDSWNNQDFSIEGTAPDSMFAPERGFGYLWNSVPGVRSSLGWAIGGEESYSVNFQETLVTNSTTHLRYYLQLPGGQVIRVSPISTSLTWTNDD